MKMQEQLMTNRHLLDLNPILSVSRKCAPGHSFGPRIRRYTLMHYVISGKGVFYARGQEFPVRGGQVFLILPGEVTTYTADAEDPWHYCWVGFDGSLSRRFAELPAVFSVEEKLFLDIFPEDGASNPEYQVAAGLLRLYGELFSGPDRGNRHVQRVENYIRTAYMQSITVAGIARELNLDRRYLTRLFKEKTGQSVQEYLIRVRMEEADRCLAQGYSVSDAARLCGYEDVPNFSRMYKKHYGISPANRKNR